MVERNLSETAQSAAASAQQAVAGAEQYVSKTAEAAREYASKGYDAAREYANAGIEVAGRVRDNLSEFVRREPWIAVVAAFAVGYVTARILRRLSI
jgi:ElaB/YqjD/DUF883 family membrane-anchored ribosome-binding protein